MSAERLQRYIRKIRQAILSFIVQSSKFDCFRLWFYDGYNKDENNGTRVGPILSNRLEVSEWVWNI